MVKQFYTPESARVASELKKVHRGLEDVQRPTGTEKDRTLLKVQAAVSDLAAQQAEVEAAVAELSAQSVHTFQPAPLDVSAGTPGAYPTFSRAMSFAAPVGGARVATLTLAADFVRLSSSGNITIWLEILQAGTSTWKRTSAFYVGDVASAPAGWGDPSMNESVQLVVANAAQAGMTIRLHTHTFVAGVVNARMQNIAATLTYGARV